MKINTISTYILVCLLTSRHWNLLVPVRADEEVDGSDAVPAGGPSRTSGTEDEAEKATETPKKTGVELCIKKDTKATPQFDHNKSGQVVTYTAKDGFGFKSVKQKGTEIWKAKDESEYATKVVLNGKGKKEKKVTIYFPNNTTKVFGKDKNNPWSEVKQPANDPVNTPSSTPSSGGPCGSGPMTGGMSYGGDPNEHGMRRRGSFGRDPNEHGMSYGGDPNEHGMSYGGDPNEHGMRRRGSFGRDPNEHGMSYGGDPNGHGGLERGGSSDKTKDGGSSTHTSGGSGTPASQPNDTEPTTPQSTAKVLQPEEYPNDIKLFKADPDDTTKDKELSTGEYKVKHDVDEHIYEFNDGVKCSLLKIKDKDAWKYDSCKHNAKYPKSVGVMKETIFIYFEGQYEVYSNRSNEWKLYSTVKREPNQVKTGGQPAGGEGTKQSTPATQ